MPSNGNPNWNLFDFRVIDLSRRRAENKRHWLHSEWEHRMNFAMPSWAMHTVDWWCNANVFEMVRQRHIIDRCTRRQRSGMHQQFLTIFRSLPLSSSLWNHYKNVLSCSSSASLKLIECSCKSSSSSSSSWRSAERRAFVLHSTRNTTWNDMGASQLL